MSGATSTSPCSTIGFDEYEANLATGELRKHGVRVHLRHQSFVILAALLERPGEIVSREELRNRLWGADIFVDFENDLNAIVARLRQVLCDGAEEPRFIETVPRYGYRFIAQVSYPPVSRQVYRPRILVLPFVNLNGDSDGGYRADAITDEVITAMASLHPERLGVIAVTTSMRYKGGHTDIGRIARELDVQYITEGSVHWAGNLIRVNVRLIQSRDQTQLFARRYEALFADIFQLHASIAADVAGSIPALDRNLLGRPLPRKPTEDMGAYDEYIKGRHQLGKYTAESLNAAKQHFEAALARDPSFLAACNALAELYWSVGFWGYVPPEETDRIGRFYALRALEIDPGSAEAHVLVSLFSKNVDNKPNHYHWTEIQNDIARARAINPGSRLVRIRHAMVQAILGDPDQAAAELQRPLESDPLSFDIQAWLTMMLYLGRHFDRALEYGERLLHLEPNHFLPYQLLGYIYLAMQRLSESARSFRKAVQLSNNLAISLGLLGLSLGIGGNRHDAEGLLEQLRNRAHREYVKPTCFALIQIGLGNIDDAFLWLDKAIDAPDRHIEPIKTYPFLDPIRSDERFSALLHKMNLA